jgi:hypothetical protein
MLLLAKSTAEPSSQILFLIGLFVLIIWGITRFYVFSMENSKMQNIWMMLIVPFVIPSLTGLVYTIVNVFILTNTKQSGSFWSQAGTNITILEILVFFWGIITWNSLKNGSSGGFFSPSLGETRHLKKLVEKMFIIPIILIIIFIGLLVFNSK